MSTIVLISCSKTKLHFLSEAKDLYTGEVFKKSLKYAQLLTKPNNIYILSAKHKLLKLEQRIRYYNKTLKGMKPKDIKKWSSSVINQLGKVSNLQKDKIIILAGKDYYRYLICGMCNYEIPMKHINMYCRQRWLMKQINKLERKINLI